MQYNGLHQHDSVLVGACKPCISPTNPQGHYSLASYSYMP